MINVEKHILYWKTSAEEDLSAAENLLLANKIRHGLFFLHLTTEKILKAHICKQTKDIPPRIHNLIRLAELIDINFKDDDIDLFAEMNPFYLEGRYPETLTKAPSIEEAEHYLSKTKQVYTWLINQL